MKSSNYVRALLGGVAAAGVAAMLGLGGMGAVAQDKTPIKIGITLPLTGADAEDALLNGASPETAPPDAARDRTRPYPVVGQLDWLFFGYLSLQFFIWLCPTDVVREHVTRVTRGPPTS